MENVKLILKNIAIMAALLAVASLLGFLFRRTGFQDTNIVLVYLLSVVLTAWLTRRMAFGILAAVLATFLFYYFFVLPYFAFAVDDLNYIITFATLAVTALVTGTLTSRAQKNARDAQDRETEAKALYDLTRQLSPANDIGDIARITAGAISSSFGCDAVCLCEGVDKDALGDIEVGKAYNWPIQGSTEVLGMLYIPAANAKKLNEKQLRLLHSMLESTALAMDRLRSAERHRRSREETEQERYRATLLRSISHDLRTPLTGIMGTAEMLEARLQDNGPARQLAADIYKDADWLHAMVVNILSLTRLHDGSIVLNKQMEAVEEVIESAVAHISKRYPALDVDVEMPDDVLMLPMDAKLVEQVFVNLLDNAAKHMPPGGAIGIAVKKLPGEGMVEFTVTDSGPGIREADLRRVFQQFYTENREHADLRQGAGLGLAICDTIIRAHGGTITARNRADSHGAEIIFILPVEEANERKQ